MAWVSDGIFSTGTDVELTEAWSINAAYQHIWGAAGTFGGKWRTSVYGGYVSRELQRQRHPADQPAVRGRHASVTRVARRRRSPASPRKSATSCSPDFSFYQVGSRTQFNPHPLMDIGLDVFYTKVNTAYKGPVNWAANGSRPACANSAILGCSFDDKGVVTRR